ncbi:MAG: hypothetical protein WBC44_16065, partial [Planctomycetaceae bacterium]
KIGNEFYEAVQRILRPAVGTALCGTDFTAEDTESAEKQFLRDFCDLRGELLLGLGVRPVVVGSLSVAAGYPDPSAHETWESPEASFYGDGDSTLHVYHASKGTPKRLDLPLIGSRLEERQTIPRWNSLEN